MIRSKSPQLNNIQKIREKPWRMDVNMRKNKKSHIHIERIGVRWSHLLQIRDVKEDKEDVVKEGARKKIEAEA